METVQRCFFPGCRLQRPDDHENFLNLFTDLRLDSDHSVSELLTHLSLHFRTKHIVRNNPLGHTTDTTGKQEREIILEILTKFFPLQFHLKRHRTARTDIISQGRLQNLLPFLGLSQKPHEHGLQDSASTEEWLTPLAEFSSHSPTSCLAAISLQCRRACAADNKQHGKHYSCSCPPLLCRYTPSQLNSITSYNSCQHALPNAAGNIHAEKHHGWPGQIWNKPALTFAPTSKSHLCHK